MILLKAILGCFFAVGVLAAAIIVAAFLIRCARIGGKCFLSWWKRRATKRIDTWLGRSGV